MFNQIPLTIRKNLYEILKKDYQKNEKIIERVAACLTISQDAQDFMNLISDIYQLGFSDAVDSYRNELKKLGYQVEIKTKS